MLGVHFGASRSKILGFGWGYEPAIGLSSQKGRDVIREDGMGEAKDRAGDAPETLSYGLGGLYRSRDSTLPASSNNRGIESFLVRFRETNLQKSKAILFRAVADPFVP